MESRKRIVIIIAITSLIAFVVVSLGIILFLTKGLGMKELKETYENQYYHIDSSSNEVTFGVASIFDDFKESGYFHYFDNEDHFVMISEFGLQKYECTGICYCESMERRDMGQLGIRGLVLVGIFTFGLMGGTLLIRKIIQKYCHKEIGDQCDPTEEVQSDLKECVPVEDEGKQEIGGFEGIEDEEEEYWDVDEESRDEAEEDFEKVHVPFSCRGDCVVNDRLEAPFQELALDYRCEVLKLKLDDLHMFDRIDHNVEQKLESAKQKFIEHHLIPFCEGYSVSIGRKVIDRIDTVVHYNSCVGGYKAGRGRFTNPFVQCSLN